MDRRPDLGDNALMTRRNTVWLFAGLALLLWLSAFALAQQVVAATSGAAGDAYQMLAAPPAVAYDEPVSNQAHELTHTFPVLVPIARFFDLTGSVFVLLPLTVTVVILLARRGHGWWALWVGACGMGGWMISQTVKHVVDRPRPTWPDPYETLMSPSFPSGHAMAGIYGYVVFGVVALALLPRRWPGVVLIIFGVLMGPSRVLLGVHWPTDVLAGWLLASGWACAMAALVLAVRNARAARVTPAPL